MTLKDQFLKASVIEGVVDNSEVIAATNAMIADEFAIGFADWIRVCKLKGRPYDFDNIKELLEIYKDEKEL